MKLPERFQKVSFRGWFCLGRALRYAKLRNAREIERRGPRKATGQRRVLGRERPHFSILRIAKVTRGVAPALRRL